MRVSPLPGVSLAAIFVATSLGVAAQSNNKSATSNPAGSTREAASAVAAPVTPAPSKDSPLGKWPTVLPLAVLFLTVKMPFLSPLSLTVTFSEPV